ncbi:catalase [Derxia lacustris]|uniref:catalase n=1 Tax=Derxia lacustris TaxID=764842 RepID=UPI00111C31E4|nr:catalase [Derxia lacustris]
MKKSRPVPATAGNAKLAALDADRLPRDLEHITTQQGLKVEDDANSLKAGLRGPTLLEDFALREKITHFDHERIPERVVHARGAAAHGYFESYGDWSAFTAASFLSQPGKKTPVFTRFSTVAGSRGSTDAARDARGFAVKFYTDEGNFDLVGNNIPVFFIQDAIKFPDLIHAVKPEPHNEIPQAASAHDTFWDFISLTPESTHMVLWVMSDRGIPRSFRMMEGFGVHSFRLVCPKGTSRFVKFHWKPRLGVHALAWDEALKISGKDPDFHRRDLWEAIEQQRFPEWELGVQIVEEADVERLGIDLLDPTKLIPEERVPVTRLGRMVLDRNPDNFFAETEQVAFHPGHVVRGIDFSDDPLLQGRLFSYTDTQLLRLGGPNFAQLPINKPVCPFHHHQRDGLGQQTIPVGRVSYAPSSLETGKPVHLGLLEGGYRSFPEPVEGTKLRGKPASFADHYSQARLFYLSQTPAERKHLQSAIAFELSKVEALHVRERMVANLANVDPELAAAVADPLGLVAPAPAGELAEVVPSPMLSMMRGPGPIDGRKVALLVADGADHAAVELLKSALAGLGLVAQLVGPSLKPLAGRSGTPLAPDFTFENSAALFFDAVALPGGAANCAALMAIGKARTFVAEAYAHGKPILAFEGTAPLLAAAGLPQSAAGPANPAEGVFVEPVAGPLLQGFAEALALHRIWERSGLESIAI